MTRIFLAANSIMAVVAVFINIIFVILVLLRTSSEETERLDSILTGFQYFTRPLKIDKKSVSLNELIRKTVTLYKMGMKE